MVERDRTGRSVVRDLRSVSPLTLMPCPATRHDDDPDTALVHLVGSAAAPLGGDVLEVTVEVGPGAALSLRAIGATLALPGQHPGPSRTSMTFQVADGGRLEYLTEPTIVAAGADHHADLRADLAADARLRCREVVVLGRSGERPGRFRGDTQVRRDGATLLCQGLDLGDPDLDACPAYLAGHRVVATELLVGDAGPPEPVVGDWWSLVPLPHGGSLATVLAEDTIAAYRLLDTATRPARPARDPEAIAAPGYAVPGHAAPGQVDREPAHATGLR
ncbi:urease accessory protein UreD [Saccharothrix longispora]|uniref:Urease accessory protein UreD n=1 Tax=Saccharothrix longispora TaxID=33920 RepID=A0ABU1PVD4_9PSEU|nr:urease accessory protein [Saccharothrix longispora]